MDKYEIPQYPMTRLRYFNNQFLDETDFIADQAAHLAHERAHLRALCAPGVLEGLTVAFTGANAPLQVAAGIAVDSNGRLIVLDHAASGPPPSRLTAGNYLLYIQYAEVATNPAPPSDSKRWTSQPVIDAVTGAANLPDAAIVLGSFTVSASQLISAQSAAGRQFGGLRLPGPDPTTTATLTNSNDGPSDGAVLTGTLTVRRPLGPNATLQTASLTLTNGNTSSTSTVAEAAVNLNPYDPGSNPPSLQIKALADGNGSGDLLVLSKPPGNPAAPPVERLRIKSTGEAVFAGPATLQSTLAVTGSVTTDIVLAAGKSVTVSAGGTFKHGIKTISIPTQAIAAYSSDFNIPSALDVFGGGYVILPVPGVPVGARIAAIRAKIDVAGTVTVRFYNKVMAATAAPSWATLDAWRQSVAGPGIRLVTVNIKNADNTNYLVSTYTEMLIQIAANGTDVNHVYEVELDYDQS